MVFGRKEDLALATGTRTHAHCRRQIKCGGDETCMSITRRWDEHKCRSNVPRIKQYNNCAIREHPGTWLYQLSYHAWALAIIMGNLNELWEATFGIPR